MSAERKEEHLVAKLLRETLENVSSRAEEFENSISNIENCNELTFLDFDIKKSEEVAQEKISFVSFLRSKNIYYVSGDYVQSLGSFRFKVHEKTLDFPRNWSFFNELYDALIYGNHCIYFNFTIGMDKENLLRILFNNSQKLNNLIFFIEEDLIYIALLYFDEKVLKEILSYLDGKITEKKSSSFPFNELGW